MKQIKNSLPLNKEIKMKWSILILIGILLIPAGLATDGITGALVSSTTEEFPVLNDANIRILQTKYDPYPAEPGQMITLWIAVQNFGNDDIDNVYLRIVPEYPFSLPRGDGIEEAGRIHAFGERLVEYDLLVDEDALEGTYGFEVQQCSDENCVYVLRKSEVQISVRTGGSPRIRVGLEDTGTFWGGKSGEVTLNIVNRGQLDIKFLTLTLLPSEEYEILSTRDVYIGELESDDFETADFTIFIDEDMSKKSSEYIYLPVKVEYTDSNNHDYVDQAQVELKVYSQKDLKRFGLMQAGGRSNIGYIFLFLIFGVAGYVYWKKKIKKKPQQVVANS